MRRKSEEFSERGYFVSECRDACWRVIDELDAKIKMEKDERQRQRMLGQRNAIKSFAPADFGIPVTQGEWLGFLYPEIDENGTLHFTFVPVSPTCRRRQNVKITLAVFMSTLRLNPPQSDIFLTKKPATWLKSRAFKLCQRVDLNHRPKAYESSALPLSYSGEIIIRFAM